MNQDLNIKRNTIKLINKALACSETKAIAAKKLGLSSRGLYNKMKLYEMD